MKGQNLGYCCKKIKHDPKTEGESFDYLFNLDKVGTNEEKITKKEHKEKNQYKSTT